MAKIRIIQTCHDIYIYIYIVAWFVAGRIHNATAEGPLDKLQQVSATETAVSAKDSASSIERTFFLMRPDLNTQEVQLRSISLPKTCLSCLERWVQASSRMIPETLSRPDKTPPPHWPGVHPGLPGVPPWLRKQSHARCTCLPFDLGLGVGVARKKVRREP